MWSHCGRHKLVKKFKKTKVPIPRTFLTLWSGYKRSKKFWNLHFWKKWIHQGPIVYLRHRHTWTILPLFTVIVTSLGNFWRSLATNCLLKLAQMYWLWLFGLFWKHYFSCKNCCGYLLGILGNNLGYSILQHLVTLFTEDNQTLPHEK